MRTAAGRSAGRSTRSGTTARCGRTFSLFG